MKKLIALFALCMLAATAAFADDVPAGELAALNDLRALATGDVTFTARDGHIVSVFADNCGLSSLPATLGDLSYLERLELRGNNLTELTDAFSGLNNLKVLDVGENKLATLTANSAWFPNLEELSADGNEIVILMPMLGNLTNLKKLNLANNKISLVFTNFASLGNLTRLDLGTNELTYVPTEIGYAESLEWLNLDNNKIEELHYTVGNMSALKYLSVNNNKLIYLPAVIEDLTNLAELSLENNGLESLPTEFCNLSSLRWASLSGNKLTALPTTIDLLDSLEYLNISGNKLTYLPANMVGMDNLASLDASENELTSIPSVITYMRSLRTLDISGNNFPEFPEVVCSLTGLVSLSAASNGFLSVPSSLSALTGLKTLDLSRNELTALPDSLSALKNNNWNSEQPDLNYNRLSLTQLKKLLSDENAAVQLTTQHDIPDDVVDYTPVNTPEEFDAAEDGANVDIRFKLIAVNNSRDLGGDIYAVTGDRLRGIRLDFGSEGFTGAEGSKFTLLDGTVASDDEGKYIVVGKYSVVDGDPLRPLGLTKVGLNKNNLVRVWGKIVKSEFSAEGPSCVIDNGSGPLTVKGINGSVGDFIKVIGISTPSGVRYIPRFD